MTQLALGTLRPLDVACTYPGHRYALPCRARPGEPCQWSDPSAHRGEYHAERRVAAGERLPTADQILAQRGLVATELDLEIDEGDDAEPDEGSAP